jgi:hypothetical protein
VKTLPSVCPVPCELELLGTTPLLEESKLTPELEETEPELP